MRRFLFSLFLFYLLSVRSFQAFALDTVFAGNNAIPESQSGFMAEQYEVAIGQKMQRGLENFFLGWLEVPQGVKSEIGFRRENYLPVGLESFFVGAAKGAFRGGARMAVGFYEFFTSPYPQPPIMQEMSEWLY